MITSGDGGPTPVLVVGAGPTGLALAHGLLAAGVQPRIIDRRVEPRRPSRAMLIQPRTLEVLRPFGVVDALLARAHRLDVVRMHTSTRSVRLDLSGLRADDTPYGMVLIRQAETEAVLAECLAARGVAVEWGSTLTGLRQTNDQVVSTVRGPDGRFESVTSAYVVGCDGAESCVRSDAGIEFHRRPFRHSVLLADVDVAGATDSETVHVFPRADGMIALFAAGDVAKWRVLTTHRRSPEPGGVGPDPLGAVTQVIHAAGVRVERLAWSADVPMRYGLAAHYRAGRVLVAGDAAHVHSPAGAQGMNLGIQDAVNLAWKLGLVISGRAVDSLLDTYEKERRPIARMSILLTGLAFWGESSTNPVVGFGRTWLAPPLAPLLLAQRWVTRELLRAVGQLRWGYARSELSVEGQPRMRAGTRAGSRLPDAPLVLDGTGTSLHEITAGPRLQLIVFGPTSEWLGPLASRFDELVTVHRVSRVVLPGVLHDAKGLAWRRLGVGTSAHVLVRPDGHIAFRAAGVDLRGLERYLAGALQHGPTRSAAGATPV